MRETKAFRLAEISYWATPPEAKITGRHITSSERLEAAITAYLDAVYVQDLPSLTRAYVDILETQSRLDAFMSKIPEVYSYEAPPPEIPQQQPADSSAAKTVEQNSGAGVLDMWQSRYNPSLWDWWWRKEESRTRSAAMSIASFLGRRSN